MLGSFFFIICNALPYSFVLEYSCLVEYLWLTAYVVSGLYIIAKYISVRLYFIAFIFLFLTAFSDYRLSLIPVFFIWLYREPTIDFPYFDRAAKYLFTLPALFLFFNLCGYKLDCPTTVMIWFFGLPIFLLSFVFISIAKKWTVPVLIICNAILVISIVLSGSLTPPSFFQIKSSTAVSVLDKNSLLGIAKNTRIITADEISKISNRDAIVTAILSEAPESLKNYPLNKNIRAYFLFGEHDNLNNFIKGSIGKEFNSDNYKRKGPWEVFQPNINKLFFINSNRYLMYCSNIGSTLKDNIRGLPLVWDYNSWGVPIVLAKMQYEGNSKVFLFGDSDSVVGFLAPYNRLFLYDLYDQTPFKWIISLFLLVIISSCLYIKKRIYCIVAAMLLIGVSIIFQNTVVRWTPKPEQF